MKAQENYSLLAIGLQVVFSQKLGNEGDLNIFLFSCGKSKDKRNRPETQRKSINFEF